MDDLTAQRSRPPGRPAEHASSTIEYIGLGSLATLLVTGVAGALDSAAGDRLAAALVRRLISAIAATE